MSDKEIAFIGKITAGATHEINNVLASIKEITGLMEDLISMSSDESFPYRDKFKKAIPGILDQVRRGVILTRQLNKFSHLTDNRTGQVELNEFIDHLVFLTTRFATIKNVELVFKPVSNNMKLNTMPVHLQMALYYCISYFLVNTVNGGKISIYPVTNEGFLTIKINLNGEIAEGKKLFKDSSTSEELLNLQYVLSLLESKVEFNELEQSIILNIKSL